MAKTAIVTAAPRAVRLGARGGRRDDSARVLKVSGESALHRPPSAAFPKFNASDREQAAFPGSFATLMLDGHAVKARVERNAAGASESSIVVNVEPGREKTVHSRPTGEHQPARSPANSP